MILQNDELAPANGSLIAGEGNHWRAFAAPTVDSFLAGGPNFNTSGTHPFDLAWAAWTNLPAITTSALTSTGAISGTTGTFSGAIGVNGATPPTQAALPTTLADVITILVNLGFCASS